VLIGCDRSLRESLPIVQARGIPGRRRGDAARAFRASRWTTARRKAREHIRDLGHTRVAIVTSGPTRPGRSDGSHRMPRSPST
jgi:hypothetical protein